MAVRTVHPLRLNQLREALEAPESTLPRLERLAFRRVIRGRVRRRSLSRTRPPPIELGPHRVMVPVVVVVGRVSKAKRRSWPGSRAPVLPLLGLRRRHLRAPATGA